MVAAGEGISASGIERCDDAPRHVSDLVLPGFEVLERVGTRQDLALAGVLALVYNIGEVEMRAACDGIEQVFGASRAVTVDVFDGVGVCVG